MFSPVGKSYGKSFMHPNDLGIGLKVLAPDDPVRWAIFWPSGEFDRKPFMYQEDFHKRVI